MAFILTHYESNVNKFVTTVEIPFQWQVDLKPNQNGNLPIAFRTIYNLSLIHI